MKLWSSIPTWANDKKNNCFWVIISRSGSWANGTLNCLSKASKAAFSPVIPATFSSVETTVVNKTQLFTRDVKRIAPNVWFPLMLYWSTRQRKRCWKRSIGASALNQGWFSRYNCRTVAIKPCVSCCPTKLPRAPKLRAERVFRSKKGCRRRLTGKKIWLKCSE